MFELLIALSLLAFIAAALSSTLGLGIRLYKRTDTHDQTASALAARIRLRTMIGAALPPSRLTPFTTEFLGNSNGFSFTTLSARGAAPDAAAFRVAVSVLDKELQLQVAALGDDGHQAPYSTLTLVIDPDQVMFSYLDGAADPPDWRAFWSEPDRLPDLVRIEIAPGSIPAWPEFTAATYLGP
ncbi:hypothetical protein [Frigidibacter sp. SD6-1]|uniref:hypothetical protein n=1 Tax=Frigidibacter sp. SD6-1 TaxID=3032581 RepID=UPI0024DF592E|nr:hypothetical protein [Frigidibacter sp. SD6-1]